MKSHPLESSVTQPLVPKRQPITPNPDQEGHSPQTAPCRWVPTLQGMGRRLIHPWCAEGMTCHRAIRCPTRGTALGSSAGYVTWAELSETWRWL